ncbi:distal membrane-arm assembly complex protein 2-like [Daphnia carinata]|uniref:distal membrane-arm assembly complex protein 2-like n=1 Tax=Daphnia carinata TaxID=120202 RepID=UPI00257E5EA0|nr:distal membrane-arm assembly complex protein 2-like [Daphnia carinata]
MAISYSRLIQLRLAQKCFQRSCRSVSRQRPIAASSQISKIDHKKMIEPEKKEDRVIYELPKVHVEEKKTALALFSSDTNYGIKVIEVINAIKFTPYGIRQAWDIFQEDKLLRSQVYIKERAEFLGPELATAHFLCYRGGKVRFHGQEDWITQDPDSDTLTSLPKFYVGSYKVEAADCSKMTLIYEGLENMKKMENLKWLSLESCPYIDDWCLDRISGEYGDTLEYLDIRNCPLVTDKGIASLSKMKKLKTLILGGHPEAKNLELVCLMLEDILPEITIRGIVYCDTSLLKPNEANE